MLKPIKTSINITRINPLQSTNIAEVVDNIIERHKIEEPIVWVEDINKLKGEDAGALIAMDVDDEFHMMQGPDVGGNFYRLVKNSDVFDFTSMLIIIQPSIPSLANLVYNATKQAKMGNNELQEFLESCTIIIYGDDDAYHHDICRTIGSVMSNNMTNIEYHWA